MTPPDLSRLDDQVALIEGRLGDATIPSSARGVIPSTIYSEVASLGEEVHNRLRHDIAIPPEAYLEEMTSFQSWMDLALNAKSNPVIVRAQIMFNISFHDVVQNIIRRQ